MKNLMILLLSLSSSLLTAQITSTWTGGTPGKESNWNEARNWNTNSVPNEFTFVIIQQTNSGHHALPVIKEEVEVAGIEIYNNAKLIIEQGGTLKIDGLYTATDGIQVFGGELINKGKLELRNIDSKSTQIDLAFETKRAHCMYAELYQKYENGK